MYGVRIVAFKELKKEIATGTVSTLDLRNDAVDSTKLLETDSYSMNVLTLTGTTNQLVLGTTNTITITAPAPSVSRIYTIPDAGGTSSFVMTAGTQTVTGQLTLSNASGNLIHGTNTNDSASAGYLGEYIESVVSSFTNHTTTGQYGDLTSISLTSGDWDILVTSETFINTATWTRADIGIGVVSGNNAPFSDTRQSQSWVSSATTPTQITMTSFHRLSLSSTTTVYLKYLASYSAGQAQALGKISARRVR